MALSGHQDLFCAPAAKVACRNSLACGVVEFNFQVVVLFGVGHWLTANEDMPSESVDLTESREFAVVSEPRNELIES